MPDAGPQIASRHHTHIDQAMACCRLIGAHIDSLADELDDENPAKPCLREQAEEYRLAGGGVPVGPLRRPEGEVIRLLPRS